MAVFSHSLSNQASVYLGQGDYSPVFNVVVCLFLSLPFQTICAFPVLQRLFQVEAAERPSSPGRRGALAAQAATTISRAAPGRTQVQVPSPGSYLHGLLVREGGIPQVEKETHSLLGGH